MSSSAAQTPTTQRRRRITVPSGTGPQRRFWASAARFRLFLGGIGSGKTYAGAVEILRQPAQTTGVVLAPTYPMLRDATLRSFIDLARPLIADFNVSTMVMELTNGSRILWRSADNPDRLRGPNIAWFWLDEAAMMEPDVWRIMLGRLRRLPAHAWVTTTPRGRNWLYHTFEAGRVGYDTVRSSTRDNVHLPQDFVANLTDDYTADFARQEIDGEYVDPSGALFRRDWFRVVESAPDGLRWFRYWDLAASVKSSADYTASAAVALADDGTLYVRDVIRGRYEWPDQRRIIVQTMQAEPDVVHGIEEALHGLAAVQDLQRDPSIAHVAMQGIRVERDKLQRAMPWAARAERGSVALVRGAWIPAFLDEVTMFPDVPHDDQVDAVSGAVGMIGTGGSVFVFGG